MKKLLILSLSLALLSILHCSSNFQKFEHLRNPQISQKEKQKMIVLEMKGRPDETSGKAFSELYRLYFKLKNNTIKNALPHSRWPTPPETPKEEWIGIFAIPVSQNVTELPEGAKENVRLEYWEYGTVVEFIHEGPYDMVGSSIQTINSHAKKNGYRITGPHEEVYLKGPGMFFKGDPKNYLTIIRYCLKK